MQILLNPEEWALNLYDNIVDNNEYKLSNYIIESEHENDYLLIHTITWAIYVLTKEERENIISNDVLIKNRVVVPSQLDEVEIAHQAFITRMTRKKLPTYDQLVSYIILTTTSCNARCDYCYEKDLTKKEFMTLDTAEKVVQFILKTKNPEKEEIRIQWFGGEPLLNTQVIEYIHSRLKKHNIKTNTHIVTNGYLLTNDVVERLNDWGVRHIQITIDGTKEKYNKIKNYVYSDIDAFLTVVNNIHNVLNKTNTKISIRFNASNDNIFHLYDDVLYFQEEFKEYENKKIDFYVAPLFQLINDDSEIVDGYDEELERLKEIVRVGGTERYYNKNSSVGVLKRDNINHNCMAFGGIAVSITPNGNFTPCEHCIENDIIGNITDGVTDISVIEKWNTFNDITKINYCLESKCPYHPMCPKFYNCPNELICKNDKSRNKMLNKIKNSLVETKNYYDEQLKKIKGEQ